MKKIFRLNKIHLLLTCLLLLRLSGRAQQTPADIRNSFETYSKNTLHEKVFVHTDKTAYLTGELMWFKVYCVDAASNKPLNVSKVAYVEVLDNNNSPVLQAKIALKNGSGSGSVYVPVSVTNGSYKLRSYTAWMKNFGPDYYFEKDLTIINPLKSPEAVSTKVKAGYDFQFFPEGGNLVSGIASKVAFRAVGSDGKGINLHGAVIDQRNDTVSRFKPLKFGIGAFTFTPAAGNTYRAVVYTQGSKPLVKDLPAVSDRGYVMHLSNGSSNKLLISVKTNGGSGDLYLFAQTRQQVKIALSATLNNDSARFSIDKNLLGDGISSITIFNDAKKPVCERLYFKRPTQQKLVLTSGVDQQQYSTRKKVAVNIAAADQTGKPLVSDLSVSVYHLDSLQTADAADIYSYLWLSGDLKGSIQSPEYYFNNTGAEADEAADNLMLSQGWRRFQWNDVLSNKPALFNFLPEYNGHLITARILNSANSTPANEVVAYLGVPGKRVQLTTAKSDSAGRLLFNMKDFYGPGEIVVQTNSEKDSTYHIDVQSPFSDQYSKTPLPAFNLTPASRSAIEGLSIGMQVQNIYAGNKTKQFDNPVTDSSAFYGTPYKTYKLDDFTRFTTMEEVLREYVSEVNIVRTRGRFHIKVISSDGFLDGDPLVMLDGVPVFNIDKVIAIDPLKIRRLEVMRNRYFWQAIDAEGVFSFTSYKGDLGGYEIDPRAVVLDYEGLQMERQFYSPVYETDQQAGSPLPDFRNLLYWSPAAGTGKDGKKTLSFYTSDQTGRYIGIIQGITAGGEAGSQVFSFEVKQNYSAEIKK